MASTSSWVQRLCQSCCSNWRPPGSSRARTGWVGFLLVLLVIMLSVTKAEEVASDAAPSPLSSSPSRPLSVISSTTTTPSSTSPSTSTTAASTETPLPTAAELKGIEVDTSSWIPITPGRHPKPRHRLQPAEIRHPKSFLSRLSPSSSPEDSFHPHFGQRLVKKPHLLPQPRPVSSIAQTRPFVPLQNLHGRKKKKQLKKHLISDRIIRVHNIQSSPNGGGFYSPTQPLIRKKKKAVPLENQENDQVPEGSRAFIRLVSTVAPQPSSATASSSSRSSSSSSTPSASSTTEASGAKRRTVVRRLRPTKDVLLASSSPATTTERTSLVEKMMKQRMRVKDSLLARVQGRFRARSTTPAPSGQDQAGEALASNSRKAIQNDLRLLRRNRFRSSTATARGTTTTTTTSTTTTASTSTTSSSSTSGSTSTTTGSTTATIPTPTSTTTTTASHPTTAAPSSTTSTSGTTPEAFKSTSNKMAVDPERSDGLRKELLAAIRRKISKNRVTTTTTTSTAKPVEEERTAPASTYRPQISLTRPEDVHVSEGASPSDNVIVSTERPAFYRPIAVPPPPPSNSSQNASNPRVQFFLRLPAKDPNGGAAVKIPNFTHIQGKLARLNAAITEGLANQRREQLEEIRVQEERERAEASEVLAEEVLEALRRDHGANFRLPAPSSSEEEPEQEATTYRPQVIFISTGSTTTTPATTTATTTTTTTSRTSTTTEAEPEITTFVAVNTVRSPTFPTTLRSNYLEVLRARQRERSTITTTTTTTATTTTTRRRTSTTSTTARTTTAEPKEHPTSHFRPGKKVQAEGVEFQANQTQGSSSEEAESVIHDITGTTVYVVGVICVIPAAGLVAWAVRYAMKKRELAHSLETGSEAGLNCAIASSTSPDDDLSSNNNEVLPNVNTAKAMTSNSKQTQMRSRQATQQQLTGALDGHDMETEDSLEQASPSEMSQVLASSIWQFDRKKLRLMAVLGEGNFGKVWKAEAENICGFDGTVLVAVKTAKEGAPTKEVTDLLQEMKIMQQIGPHPNVVTMLGVCVETEPYLLIMEYVMYGKLLTHLREQRSRQTNCFFSDDASVDENSSISSKDLTKYAYGVAKGMEFIVSKGIIHRDLAARNILMDHNKVCKISDFGLSRNLSDTGSEMYEQKTKGALPIRWMAPESLYFSVFTPKSDVWSFGILMWEIVTLGSTPYPGMGAREVMRRVRDGYRLERPSHCHPDFYKIIAKCWSGDMNKRPDFSELRKELAKLLEDQHGYIDLQNIPENKYYSMTQDSNEDEKL